MIEQVREAAYVLLFRLRNIKNARKALLLRMKAAVSSSKLPSSGKFYRDRPTGLHKFLPVLLPCATVDDIPIFSDRPR